MRFLRVLKLISFIHVCLSALSSIEGSFPDVVKSSNDLAYDENGHLAHNYLMFTNSKICREIIPTLWNELELKGRILAPYDIDSEYGRELGRDDVPLNNVRKNLACILGGLQKGTPKSYAHVQELNSVRYYPLLPGTDGSYSSSKEELKQALRNINTVEFTVVNNFEAHGPIIAAFTAFTENKRENLSVVLAPGKSVDVETYFAEEVTVTVAYKYLKSGAIPTDVEDTDEARARFVEVQLLDERSDIDGPGVDGLWGHYSGKPSRVRPHFTGQVVLNKAIMYNQVLFIGNIEYDDSGEPIPNSYHSANTYKIHQNDDLDTFKDNRHKLDHPLNTSSPDVHEYIDRQIRNSLESSAKQSKLVVSRTFTRYGFGIGRLPPQLHVALWSYWYNNKGHVQKELFAKEEPFVNHWEVSSHMTYMTQKLKSSVVLKLEEMVLDWLNSHIHPEHITDEELEVGSELKDGSRPTVSKLRNIEIETTALYGIRTYHRGSRLLQHTDRLSTHAASVIVQVAQDQVTEPWPLEIYDHAGRLHEVVMAPGDIIFYESAKNVHSRIRPFAGKEYANVFSHYRPMLWDSQSGEYLGGDKEWFLRPQPLGTVKPLRKEDLAGNAHYTPAVIRDEAKYEVQFLSRDIPRDFEIPSDLYREWLRFGCKGNCSAHV